MYVASDLWSLLLILFAITREEVVERGKLIRKTVLRDNRKKDGERNRCIWTRKMGSAVPTGAAPRGMASWEESGYNFSATGRCHPFQPLKYLQRPARGFSHRFSVFLLFDSLSVSPSSFFSSLRLLVSSSTRLCSREYISMHFPGRLALSFALPFPPSPSYARFNYQLFRVSQEFALAPPPPPRRHCFLSYAFFLLSLSLFRSSHGPHPCSLWTSDKVCACVQDIHAKENASPLHPFFPHLPPSVLSVFDPNRSYSLLDFDSSSNGGRGVFFHPLFPPHDRSGTTFRRDNRR